jgi:hypothetical protein
MIPQTKTRTEPMKIVLTVLSCASVFLLSSCGGNSSSSEVNARDIFYQSNKPGSSANGTANAGGSSASSVAYSLELKRGDAAPVPCDNRFAFKSGDAIKIHIKVNEPQYVYVLTQGPSGKKDLLYPQPGDDNRLEAGAECVIPKDGDFQFDDNAGTEHIMIGLTSQPIPQDKALELSGVEIGAKDLTGKPATVGGYSVLSDFGSTYQLGQDVSGDKQVYVSNPDRSKPTVIELAVNHTKDGDSGAPPADSGSSNPPTPPTSDQSGGGSAPLTGKWAILIGVDKFKNPNIPATGCTKDVAHLSEFFKTEANFLPDHVIELTDDQASVDNIEAKLREVAPRVKPTDLVITYFSTHGAEPREGQSGEPVIVAYDGFIPMRTMSEHIKSRINSDRLVIIIDTCHSGNTRSLGDGTDYLRELFPGVGKIIVAGCQPHETSLGGADGGIFTNSLLEGWRKEKTLKKAFVYAKDTTAQQSAQHEDHGSPHQQHPVINDASWTGNDIDIFAPVNNG